MKKRRDDWLVRLQAVVDSHAAVPFFWGKSDCVTFALDAVHAMTRFRIYKGRKWRTEAQAKAAIEAEGGLQKALQARLEAVPPAFARRGDLGLANFNDQLSVVVCNGVSFVGKSETGLGTVARSDVIEAYKI